MPVVWDLFGNGPILFWIIVSQNILSGVHLHTGKGTTEGGGVGNACKARRGDPQTTFGLRSIKLQQHKDDHIYVSYSGLIGNMYVWSYWSLDSVFYPDGWYIWSKRYTLFDRGA